MIWCVEDDVSIRDIEIYTLEQTGFAAKGFCDGDSFWVELATTDELPELVILDIMLPGEDGVSLLKKIKASSRTGDIPVIMATAKSVEYDKIKSLDMGADDYLVKPFGMMEMVSRIKAVLRRCMPKKENKTVYGDSIFPDKMLVLLMEAENRIQSGRFLHGRPDKRAIHKGYSVIRKSRCPGSQKSLHVGQLPARESL